MPRRVVPFVLALALCGAALPARASTTIAGHVDVATGSPAEARYAYDADPSTNGRLGYVIPLPAHADNHPYTLVRTAAGTGREDLDVWFYANLGPYLNPAPKDGFPDLTPADGSCYVPPASDDGVIEHGGICDGARYAIVYVAVGAGANGPTAGTSASFTFTY